MLKMRISHVRVLLVFVVVKGKPVLFVDDSRDIVYLAHVVKNGIAL